MIIEKESDLWCTPPDMISELADACSGFFMDACCNETNCIVPLQREYILTHKSKFYPELQYDYLATNPKEWHTYIRDKFGEFIGDDLSETIFMNPPYSNPEPFMQKAWSDSKHFRVLSLVKTDMSTDWFNYALEENVSRRALHHNQFSNSSKYIEPVSTGIKFLLKTMKEENRSIGIYHLRKRVKFYYNGTKAKSSGTFPSCIVIYDRRTYEDNS